jgi:hypothetical protein
VYLVVTPDSFKVPWLAKAVAPYYQIQASNVPATELCRAPPHLAAAGADATRRAPLGFGFSGPSGGAKADLELLDVTMEPVEKGDVPWVRASYTWRINSPAAARSAVVWVLFTDASGTYQKMPDGSPEFHNVHPLAYGLGRRVPELPRTLKETFDIYVPPRQWNQKLQVRMAVAIDGKLAPAAGGRRWVGLGELPELPSGAWAQR